MPEFPEVNIVINGLKKVILNQKISKITVFEQKMLRNATVVAFENFLLNETILDVVQKGKYIIYLLSNNKALISHLAMTGKYFYQNDVTKYKRNDHDHLIFELNQNNFLIYNDYRKFGFFYIKNQEELLTTLPLSKLGYMPFEALEHLDILFSKMTKIKKPIKTLLLDQSFLTGWGNIYADETLFQCKINPFEIANQITKEQLKEIIIEGNKIINDSISKGGSSVIDYTSLNAQKGTYQNYLKVYSRENLQCFNCKNLIKKEFLNGRGTFYCPFCQIKK
ncbi:DNA-formamidopyrimidine glycosylase [Mycoplasmopsis hyopharyngis]|uniref:DNA-formamidopyrimidine glycosylase n=1 Tax=Mycoplasmopsis hyopharyngis TaxID=29558 RepID=UPI003872D3A7